MSVEDIASQSSVFFRDIIYSMTERPSFGVHVFPGNAEVLVKRGGITNYHSVAYSLSNISAKNYQKSVDAH